MEQFKKTIYGYEITTKVTVVKGDIIDKALEICKEDRVYMEWLIDKLADALVHNFEFEDFQIPTVKAFKQLATKQHGYEGEDHYLDLNN